MHSVCFTYYRPLSPTRSSKLPDVRMHASHMRSHEGILQGRRGNIRHGKQQGSEVHAVQLQSKKLLKDTETEEAERNSGYIAWQLEMQCDKNTGNAASNLL